MKLFKLDLHSLRTLCHDWQEAMTIWPSAKVNVVHNYYVRAAGFYPSACCFRKTLRNLNMAQVMICQTESEDEPGEASHT